MDSPYDHVFKLIVIGDSGVGKSCLVNRFAGKEFSDSFVSTIGVDFKNVTIQVDGKCVKLQIWDTAGQERFRTITSSFYRGTKGILFVYDVTKPNSFQNLKRWIADVDIYASPDTQKILMGNKCDLFGQKRVPYESAVAFARSYKMNAFFEASAKSKSNVEDAFIEITRKLMHDAEVLSNEERVTPEKKSWVVRRQEQAHSLFMYKFVVRFLNRLRNH
jgi:Ras-related protein Rab-1A|uniref:Uncharacterized protein n=1 Tax=Vannella robusta TaxID=1487602 RepID=A0A7S4I5W8_9EUKA|mmetsp:Transcript_20956/g.26512  ORF Transcript_20956/g.26512 Transcript_20956/m.26512 type:complete len:218 (+) Transcript_20956:236-889(+)|eukprot:CAMPEP_0206185364 /NCGR_PEP_ID=MMETSP0166-20121206/1762_1 /ASSEMBLY_ACC=CAM_ASM_000260 /TAXON_ID=95228 /ORGANISM="Vannella robusta, Strain DIVA3 518/3/11/1/6" /LENGTH=217 /DNA_ID=CAMNT_0053600541 /DNA_START=163 /DNA_END=816 /DNA_ORIENTATION=-